MEFQYSAAFIFLALFSLNVAEDITTSYNGHTYVIVADDEQSWADARAACAALMPGSDLIIVDDDDENNFILSLLPASTTLGFYIGSSDIDTEGTWMNVDGTPTAYTKWNQGQPDDHRSGEDCAHYWTSAGYNWNDIPCASLLQYICELPYSFNEDGPRVEWILDFSVNQETEVQEEKINLYCNISHMTVPDNSSIQWNTILSDGDSEKLTVKSGLASIDAIFTLTEEEWKPNGFGQKVSCTLIPGDGGSDVEGPPFTAGLTVEPEYLTVNEGECKQVTVEQNIPFLCKNKPYDKDTCPVNVLAEVVDIQKLECGPVVNNHINILLKDSACNGHDLTSHVYGTVQQQSDLTVDGSFSLTVCGAMDGLYDPYHISTVTLNTKHVNRDEEWNGHTLGSFKVMVIDADSKLSGKSCYSVNDPHMRTFDDRKYEMQLEGPFYLFRHSTLPIEVQTMYENCNIYGFGGARYQATCNCGVAVRAWDDVYSINRCWRLDPEIRQRTNIQIINQSDCLEKLEVTDEGSYYKVGVSTGTTVKINKSGFKGYMDVFIYASSEDFDSTEGLCGTLNDDCTDEFKLRDSSDYSAEPEASDCSAHPYSTRPYDFADTWRVPDDENLFYGNKAIRESPVNTDDTVLTSDTKHCSCYFSDTDEKMYEENLCAPSTGVAAVCEVQSEVTGCDTQEPAEFRKRKKRQATSQFVFEYSTNSTAAAAAEWRNGWNESLAEIFCNESIYNSSIISLCEGVVGVDINQAVENCKSDILLSGGTDYLSSTLQSIQSPCIQELTKNVSAWDNSTGSPAFPDFLLSVLCSDVCYEHGDCINGTCVCDTDWYGADCDTHIDITPVITNIELCDIYDCSVMSLSGELFTDLISTPQCIITRTKMLPNGGSETLEMRTTARYYHSSLIECDVDETIRPETGDYINLYTVRTTNNNEKTTSESYSIYLTAECVDCNVTTQQCQLQTGKCFISDTCENDLTSYGCFYCDAQSAPYIWTKNTSCVDPVFSSPEEEERYEEIIAELDQLLVAGGQQKTTSTEFTPVEKPAAEWHVPVIIATVVIAVLALSAAIILVLKAKFISSAAVAHKTEESYTI